MGLLPQKGIGESLQGWQGTEYSSPVPAHSGEWMTFVQLANLENVKSIDSQFLRFPDGKEISVKYWADLLFQTAEWLVEQGLLTESRCPFRFESMRSKYLINLEPVHPTGRKFDSSRRLSNGLYLECNYSSVTIALLCHRLVTDFGQDPTQFQVQIL